MKKHTWLILIVFYVCYSFRANAQSQRTIEVTTSDTINLKATSFEYKISCADDKSIFGGMPSFGSQEKTEEKKYFPQIDSAEELLRQNHYRYSYGNENKYSLSKAGKPSVLIVLLNSEAELESLCKKLSRIQGLKGRVQNVTYEKPDAYLNTLFVRLYTAAASQAGDLAKISGGSVGPVLNITETQAGTDAVASYDKMMSELTKRTSFSGIFDADESLSQVYTRKMAFRFELK